MPESQYFTGGMSFRERKLQWLLDGKPLKLIVFNKTAHHLT